MASVVDLHAHSTVSDGTLSPSELVDHAAQRGVRLLSLTDHDDVAGLQVARESALANQMQFVNGVEISVTWRKRTLHIVGLRIDPTYSPLVDGLAAIRAGRHHRAELMAQGLEKVGIQGSLDGAYQYAKQGIISRTHFARFLIERGHAKDVSQVFKRYLVKGKPGYVEHQWATLEQAVGWIVQSGGIAVVAHPGRYELGRTLLLELFEEFRAHGGTAIEVVTGSHTPDQYVLFAKYAHLFGFKSSMGSDYHGPMHAYLEMGRLPELPKNCVPIWADWPEYQAIQSCIQMEASQTAAVNDRDAFVGSENTTGNTH